MLRVNDLVRPPIRADDLRAALAVRGIAEGTRDEPVGRGVRALLAATAAGTVITLECRGSLRNPRFVVLRRLARQLDDLVSAVDNGAARPRNSGHNPAERPSGRS